MGLATLVCQARPRVHRALRGVFECQTDHGDHHCCCGCCHAGGQGGSPVVKLRRVTAAVGDEDDGEDAWRGRARESRPVALAGACGCHTAILTLTLTLFLAQALASNPALTQASLTQTLSLTLAQAILPQPQTLALTQAILLQPLPLALTQAILLNPNPDPNPNPTQVEESELQAKLQSDMDRLFGSMPTVQTDSESAARLVRDLAAKAKASAAARQAGRASMDDGAHG